MRTHIKRITMLGAVLAAFAPALAAALPEPTGKDTLTPYGEYVLIGGGVTGFIDSKVKDNADVGGIWDLRAGIGSRWVLGAELAYVGSARSAGDFGTDLYGNGVEAVMRLQYPFEQGHWLVEPFAFVGGGWTHYNITDKTTLAYNSSDDVFVLPTGAGLMVGYNHFLVDTRFTYRETFSESLVPNNDGDKAKLRNWAVTASVGYEF